MTLLKISPETLSRAVGISLDSATVWAPSVNEAGQACGLNTPQRWALWLGQCRHESGGFKRLAESFNYDAPRLLKVFGKYYRDKPQLVAAHARSDLRPADQPAIANHVYNGRNGNRPGTNDGWDYRGSGLPQLTGLANFRGASDHLGVDFVGNPDLLRTSRRYAAMVTAYFWDTRKLNAYADRWDVDGASRAINGGDNGLVERRDFCAAAHDALVARGSTLSEMRRALAGRSE